MIKLLVGIILLAIILFSAHFIFVEHEDIIKENFEAGACTDGCPDYSVDSIPACQGDYHTFISGYDQSNCDSFDPDGVNHQYRCCNSELDTRELLPDSTPNPNFNLTPGQVCPQTGNCYSDTYNNGNGGNSGSGGDDGNSGSGGNGGNSGSGDDDDNEIPDNCPQEKLPCVGDADTFRSIYNDVPCSYYVNSNHIYACEDYDNHETLGSEEPNPNYNISAARICPQAGYCISSQDIQELNNFSFDNNIFEYSSSDDSIVPYSAGDITLQNIDVSLSKGTIDNEGNFVSSITNDNISLVSEQTFELSDDEKVANHMIVFKFILSIRNTEINQVRYKIFKFKDDSFDDFNSSPDTECWEKQTQEECSSPCFWDEGNCHQQFPCWNKNNEDDCSPEHCQWNYSDSTCNNLDETDNQHTSSSCESSDLSNNFVSHECQQEINDDFNGVLESILVNNQYHNNLNHDEEYNTNNYDDITSENNDIIKKLVNYKYNYVNNYSKSGNRFHDLDSNPATRCPNYTSYENLEFPYNNNNKYDVNNQNEFVSNNIEQMSNCLADNSCTLRTEAVQYICKPKCEGIIEIDEECGSNCYKSSNIKNEYNLDNVCINKDESNCTNSNLCYWMNYDDGSGYCVPKMCGEGVGDEFFSPENRKKYCNKYCVGIDNDDNNLCRNFYSSQEDLDKNCSDPICIQITYNPLTCEQK